jgi:hypothetical protein
MTSSRRNASAGQWYEELNECEIGQGPAYSCWSMIPWDKAVGSSLYWQRVLHIVFVGGCTAIYAYYLFERPSPLKALTKANNE